MIRESRITNHESRITLQESYRYCQGVAKKRARNFYYSFLVLPPEKKRAMCAIYAFMRYCDDLSDSDERVSSKRDLLIKWRAALESALKGDYGSSPILPAFCDTVQRYRIPPQYFHRVIDGAEMDLTITRYRTFEELYSYCYCVASAVGLACIHVFGFSDEKAKEYAEYCGVAFQLTNILRDLKEDAQRGRIYLPKEDLDAFGYSEDDLMSGVTDERFRRLMTFEANRARDFYRRAQPLLPLIEPVSRPALFAMMQIYEGILNKIEQRGYDVFNGVVSLSHYEKMLIAAKACLKRLF